VTSIEHRLGPPAVFLLSGGSIAALLADVYGIAPMHVVFWAASVPSMVALAVLAMLPRVPAELRHRIRVGAVGGFVGTLGYDLVRIPFAVAGQRVFAPIESYGVLIADATTSSEFTSFLGWGYHFSNGITFGIAYAAVAARRHWLWGVAWGLALESVAVFSPFATRYAIAGQLVPILIAYGAHVFYGLPLGRLVQRMPTLPPRSVTALLAVLAVGLLGWHRPWLASPPDSPRAVVVTDRFEPEWVRIRAGECVAVENRSGSSFPTPHGTVTPASTSELCFPNAGVYRVKLGPRPYSGGFVYVDGR
jgi:hypothetical protein